MRFATTLALATLLLTASATHAGDPAVVGFAQDTLANDWRAAQAEGIAQGLAAYPDIRFVLTDGRGKTADQIQDIEDLTYQGVDILITSPMNGLAATPAIARAYRSGIPVILLTRRIVSDDYSTFIGADDRAIGTQAARYMAERLEGRGTVLMLKGVPTATTAIDRTAAFLEVMAEYPHIRVIEKTGNYLRADAIKAVEETLAEGERFDAIYSQSDSMVQGALLALEKAGIDPEPLLIVGIDYIGQAREAIRANKQDASFVYPTCAAETVAAVRALLAGEPVPRRITPPTVMVTRDNVEQVEPIF